MATNPEQVMQQAEATTEAPDNLAAAQYPNDRQEGDAAPEADAEAPQQDQQQELAAEQESAIEAPDSWSKDEKAAFASLPREQQEVISRRERERDAFVTRKAQEAATARQTVENEARQAIAQVHRAQQEQLQRYAQMFEPQRPDIRLLQSGDEQHRALYYQMDAEYRAQIAQRDEAQREADAARQQAEALEQQHIQAQRAQELALLSERIPEWSDPSQRPKLLEELQSIGTELGYSQEQMAQAGAADILALKTASDWRRKAAKYDQLNKAKMEPVRAAKNLPPVARSGAAGLGAKPSQDIAATLYPNDVRR